MSFVENSLPGQVELRRTESGYRLFRGGVPFYVKGAGGFEHLELLAARGANSVRTWGTEQTEAALPEIRRLGLTFCAGLWMEPPRRGFDYSDPSAVAEQAERLRAEALRLKDEPELLLWGLGNELELDGAADDATWIAVEELAAFLKAEDPLHPVMTVLASPDESALRQIDRLCPSIDLIGINSYGDLEKVQPRLHEIGCRRPYLVTEWGANGSWEVARTSWGAEIEPTSTEKAEQIRRRYACLRAESQCLGSYVFLWGSKQETTPTWYGLLSPEGRETEAVEAMAALWSAEPEKGRAPRVGALRLDGREATENVVVRPGVVVQAECPFLRGAGPDLGERWSVERECSDKGIGGDAEERPERLENAVTRSLAPGRAWFEAPAEAGAYRLYLEVFGPGNTVATANFPFLVRPERG